MKRFGWICLLACAAAAAEEKSSEKPPALLQVGVGLFDFHRSTHAVQFSAEYKWPFPVYGVVHSVSGVLATVHGSLYIYSGFDYDLFCGKHVVFTPSFAGGVYFKGSGKDLGYELEFRSSLELAYVFTNNMRIGVQGYHISNGSMGFRNPGEESLLLFFSIPVGGGG